METVTSTVQPLNVGRLSLDGLEKLHAEVEAAIRNRREANQMAALTEIARLVLQSGLDAERVMKHLQGKRKSKPKGSKLPPKYLDLDNPENTWAGRGKRPRWLQQKLEAGARIEDFAIAATTEVRNAST